MTDTGRSTWTVYSTRPDGGKFAVVATTWTQSGPRDADVVAVFDTAELAAHVALSSQRDYDNLRAVMAGGR